jgi:plastocyanin
MKLSIRPVSVLVALLALPAAAVARFVPPLATVHIVNFAFEPRTLTVRVGQRITFVNDDGEAHTVTADDNSFDSAGLDAHESWQHSFDKPGTYAYFCALHPHMRGTIVVTASQP